LLTSEKYSLLNTICFHMYICLIPGKSNYGVNMLNYTDPVYEIVEKTSGIRRVEVDVTYCKSETNEEERIKILDKEAKENSLFSMAFVQKLANDGDKHAKEIQAIYHGYKQYMENGDFTALKNICNRILKSKNPYTFPKDAARYLLALMAKQPVDPQLKKAKNLLNKLIPGLEKTLSKAPWQKIDKEQKITIPKRKGCKHNAFPDLIKFGNAYYAAYREAKSHVGYGDLGAVRILKGYYEPKAKIWKWNSMQLLKDAAYDLRDPRFFVDHENALRILCGGSLIDENDETISMAPHVAALKNKRWHMEKAIVDPSANGTNGQWIWRVTWNSFDNCGYAFSYSEKAFSLVRTLDGRTFEKVTEITFDNVTEASEATIRFKADGTAVALIRARRNGVIGISNPAHDYRIWKFHVIPFRIGGPNFVFSHDEKSMWAATRHFFLHPDNDIEEATILASMDQKELIPSLKLRSSYDSSYPGLVLEEDGSLTVLYYSSTVKGASSLYITRVLPKV